MFLTKAAALICLLAGTLWLAGPGSAATNPKLVVGRGGWQLERFEGNIAVLRTSVTASGRSGLLLLSCAGAQRRISLTLPQMIVGEAGAFRLMLIRPIGQVAAKRPPLLARFALEQGRSLTFLETDAGPLSVVFGLARMLQERPAALDLLMHAKTGAITFRTLEPYVLSLMFGANDSIALDNFIIACSPTAR